MKRLGSWGSTPVAELEYRVRYSAFIVESCNERNFSWAVWDMHTELGLHDESTDTVTTELVDALRSPSKTFAETRTTPPPVEVPIGASVLVDDFEDAFGDRGDQSHLASARATSLTFNEEHSEWFVIANTDSSWKGPSGASMVTFEQYEEKGTPMQRRSVFART